MTLKWITCSPKRYSQALVNLQKIGTGESMYNSTSERQKILDFWHSHGFSATTDAFSVSRATPFRWQKDVIPKKRIRRCQVRRVVPPGIRAEILRLKLLHPELGKGQLTPLLERFCRARDLLPPSGKHDGSLPEGLAQRGGSWETR